MVKEADDEFAETSVSAVFYATRSQANISFFRGLNE